MPKPKFIAVLNDDATRPLALETLAAVVEIQSDATLISSTENAVLFSGERALVDRLEALFSGHLLIEEDMALMLDVPGPSIAADAVSDARDETGDDKDPGEIVRF